MISSIKLRYKLWKLNNICEKIRLEFRNKTKDLTDSEKIQELAASASFEERCIEEEISVIYTDMLRKKARKLLLPLPEGKKYWDKCEYIYPDRKVLNNYGVVKIREVIRNEYKDKFFYFSFILAFIAALTGLVAVLKD